MPDEAAAIAGRRGKWSNPDVPHCGWVCVAEYDAKADSNAMIICEMCEAMEVRFVQVMKNERYPDELHCGCVCAGHMSGQLSAARERDRTMRSRAQRRAKFPSRKAWKVSVHGNSHIEIQGNHLVVARKADGTFQVGAKSAYDRAFKWGKKRYPSLVEAQRGCFDALEYIENMQATEAQNARSELLRSILPV